MNHRKTSVHRILMTTDCIGGVWTFCLQLAKGLGPCGVEVALACMGGSLSQAQRAEALALPNVVLFHNRCKLEWMEDPWEDVARAGEWLLELEGDLHPDLVHLNGYAHASLLWQVRDADLVLVGSYVPDGIDVSEWVFGVSKGVKAFYDIDTPVTLEQLKRRDCAYLRPDQIPRFDLYLSFTGGPVLDYLEHVYGARAALPLYCSVDPARYFREQKDPRWDLGYLGTYSLDRQDSLDILLMEPARKVITAIKFWNEPNNLSHWDFHMDPEWREYSAMIRTAADAVRRMCPQLKLVLGGMSPIDADFVRMLRGYGLLEHLDAVAVHGFPLDWNHWRINEWPEKVREIENASGLPVWITEVGVSDFGADEVQVFGLRQTTELLIDRVEHIFWYSLLDLPPTWEATTRHKESEGSAYYRHYYMGLIRADGTLKTAAGHFDPRMGICQWFHYEDPRLEFAVQWLRRLGVRKLRTGVSWADWHRPDSWRWFDRQMAAIREFDVTLTFCFTPPSRGKRPCHTSPPLVPEEFALFAEEVVSRYQSDCPPPLPSSRGNP